MGRGAEGAGGAGGGGSTSDADERIALLRRSHALLLVALPVLTAFTVAGGARIGQPGVVVQIAVLPVFAWGAIDRPRTVRALALPLLLAIGIVATGAMTEIGPTPGAGAGFLAVVLLSGLFFGRRAAWITAALVLVTHAAVGMAFGLGLLHAVDFMLLDPSRSLTWARVGFVQAVLGLLIALTVTSFLGRLERAYDARLRAERARLEIERAMAAGQRLEAVGRLAGGVAHDFNSLLSIVGGWTSILKRDVDDEERREGVEAIEAAVKRGAQLTRQLLTFARGGERPPSLTDVVARSRSMADTLARLLTGKVKVRLEASDAVPPVLIDGGLFDQVVLNLAINARDAMPNGGTLTLRVTRADAGGERVLFQASDTGTGMSDAIRSRIFDPFFTTKPVGQGTGFGLTTVFGIVSSHGGTIEVESAEGRGSTFSVYLPAAATDSLPSNPRESAVAAP